jgi:hypothetical protein
MTTATSEKGLEALIAQMTGRPPSVHSGPGFNEEPPAPFAGLGS